MANIFNQYFNKNINQIQNNIDRIKKYHIIVQITTDPKLNI